MKYESPTVDVVLFDEADIVTASIEQLTDPGLNDKFK